MLYQVRLAKSLILAAWVCITPALIAGCDRAPTMAVVQGSVNLDGAPLSDGTVRLISKDGQTATFGGIIKDGKFETRALLTNYRVEISSTQLLGKGRPASRSDSADYQAIQRIPENYNTKSQLVLDVHEGLNAPVFDLQSR